MTFRLFSVLAIRLLAIYVIILALKNLPMFVSSSLMIVQIREPHLIGTSLDEISFPYFFAGLLPFILLITLGLLLWLFSVRIVDFIYRKQISKEEGEPTSQDSLKEIQIVAFSIVGLLVLINTTPQLAQLVPSLILMREEYGFTNFTIRVQNISYSIGLILQVIIGIYLFLGAKGLAGILKKIREL